jgi:uncharacterized membrane protein YfcA
MLDFSSLTLGSAFVLFIAALLGGTLNSVAGGGSFLSFPSLYFTGVPPVNANATSTIALWPGSLAAVSAYRKELARQSRGFILWFGAISLIGGLLGAILLLKTPQSTFTQILPFLLLAATLLFAFSRNITRALRGKGDTTAKRTLGSTIALSALQLIIAIYGGYFGGGIGIMMLAALGIMGMEDIHEMNSLKTLFQTSINGVAVIYFILAGAIFWPQAVIMIVGAIVGGYGGASIARKLPQVYIRGFVIAVGTAMTIYFFGKDYGIV